jgi:LPS sulfotransferase NodH
MLTGIETGYEEKFDFPYRAAEPSLAYMLATVPRSGSTFLSHLLWQSGCLGAPLEYLNFLPTSPYSHVSGSPDKQAQLWKALLHRRTSPNGVFGVKCFPLQLRELYRTNGLLFLEVMRLLLPRGSGARVVRLKRRDQTAHAISYARAALSGVGRQEQEANGPALVEYSSEAVDYARKLIQQTEKDLDRLLSDAKAEQLVLWYEDVVDRPSLAVQRVADFLKVQVETDAAVEVPEIRQQSQSEARKWVEKYTSS